MIECVPPNPGTEQVFRVFMCPGAGCCGERSMEDTVSHLWEGCWYGNGEQYPVKHPLRKRPVDCNKLFQTALDKARTKFIPIVCPAISGAIAGCLVVDETYKDEKVDLPIDTLVLDLTMEDDEEDEIDVGDAAM